MKKFKLVLMVAMPLIILAKFYYPSFKEEQHLETLKLQFQELLFDKDSSAKVTSIRVEENVIALKVYISNIDVNEENKAIITRNSRKILPYKICNSIGMQEWLTDGKWVSIDVSASGKTAITNVRITDEDCS